jgi:hypothetical protein
MDYEIAAPEPSSLIEALRSIGYNLPTAVADIIDNSIAAGARSANVDIHWNGNDSFISIVDDGCGMSAEELYDAMRPGCRNPLAPRSKEDLGRFGLGLKTASFSQCRKLCVLTRPSGGALSVRSWDLDYVAEKKEWRLLTSPTAAAVPYVRTVEKQAHGTAIVWSALDRIHAADTADPATAHSRFNDAIDHVRDHLALTFHRFIEDGSLSLKLNGNPVKAWNPFMDYHPATYRSPDETIPFRDSHVMFRGYVLPHKDKLTDEEFRVNAGPRGWNGQQGFYVYRNKRLLVSGDWLRLGRPDLWTRDEHYKLARIRLDIPNSTDLEWHLDVKKSTARPPIPIQDRLTSLAESIRTKARTVFAYRGAYGPRSPAQELERPWVSTLNKGYRVYRINRDHPTVRAILAKCSEQIVHVEALLRLVEQTVPVQQIWLDTAEKSHDTAIPYSDVGFSQIRADLRKTFSYLVQTGLNRATVVERLRTIEPFNRHPDLISEL